MADGHAYGTIANHDTVNVGNTKRNRVLGPDLLRGLLMALMAMDHMALSLNTWEHGTGRVSESDGAVVRAWNRPAAYTVRTLTHLCGPGFTFLLGMGVVFLGRSRSSRLGWSSARLARYFAERALVLTGVTVALGLLVSGGQVWLFNIVLFALAVDYLLAGLLWLAIEKTEVLLARLVDGVMHHGREEEDDEEDVERPLMGDHDASTPASERALSISWHIHNVLLLALSVVTIWWNIWLSETHGHCRSDSETSTLATDAMTYPSRHPLLDLWFWPVTTKRIMSVFPPLAWVSFAILGIIYGRILSVRSWSISASTLGHLSAGLFFSIVFVLTRVLRIGNLSEDCLQTPDQEGNGGNPYLASPQAFFYLVKYPPDVAFWAFALAGNLLLLAILGAIPARVASRRLLILLDFGTAALFFYVVHLFVVAGAGAVMIPWFGREVGRANPMNPGSTRGIESIPAYLAIWALAMLVMWPMTRWYGQFKSTKSADSIWRFF